MEYFKTHVLLMREKALLQASVREEKKLLVENAKLKKDIAELRLQLQDKQRRRAGKALHSLAPPPTRPAPSLPVKQPDSSPPAAAAPPQTPSQGERRNRRRRGEKKACPGFESLSLGEEPRVDVSRLDIRIGRIISARRHPLAEALSVQEVDVGEPTPRTVVSKLGSKINTEELQGSLAVVLCNVRPCKLRGVVSQARLLCCSASIDEVELLAPPSGAVPGDKITFHNYPGEPDKELLSKERVWESIQPDLHTDSRGVANYKGAGFEVRGKGLCRAPTLTSCKIK
ncbi:aminoacyl tRNA synthase complex-interacting multifunctional protein 1-like [Lampris incognitus]|uniref:aminoacyl tRNA synthase complex-interacting multifunctional protein 1-like n=1 Tax=Lampris incognitus TaxID=2546036 RepID=UPI0024B524BC|nr:aminoacyl tRNA synthase complex-interacting multifunctional protein 1-like [Lampris incognitus]